MRMECQKKTFNKHGAWSLQNMGIHQTGKEVVGCIVGIVGSSITGVRPRQGKAEVQSSYVQALMVPRRGILLTSVTFLSTSCRYEWNMWHWMEWLSWHLVQTFMSDSVWTVITLTFHPVPSAHFFFFNSSNIGPDSRIVADTFIKCHRSMRLDELLEWARSVAQ